MRVVGVRLRAVLLGYGVVVGLGGSTGDGLGTCLPVLAVLAELVVEGGFGLVPGWVVASGLARGGVAGGVEVVGVVHWVLEAQAGLAGVVGVHNIIAARMG